MKRYFISIHIYVCTKRSVRLRVLFIYGKMGMEMIKVGGKTFLIRLFL